MIATGAKPLTVGSLMVVVIQTPRLASLAAGVGCAQLLPSRAVAALGSAVTVAAIAVDADIEAALAATALQGAQNDIPAMSTTWHATAQQALHNRIPLLST